MGFSTGFGTAFTAFSKMTSAYQDSYFDQVEKERENKRANDKIKQDKIDKANALVRQNQQQAFTAASSTQTAIANIDKKIADNQSSSSKNTQEQRLEIHNKLVKQKNNIINLGKKRLATLGITSEQLGIDLSSGVGTQLKPIEHEGKLYGISVEDEEIIRSSNGRLRLNGNKIETRVQEWSTTQGKMIDKQDENGEFTYEPTNQELPSLDDMFAMPESGKQSQTRVGLFNEKSLLLEKERAGTINENEQARLVEITNYLSTDAEQKWAEMGAGGKLMEKYAGGGSALDVITQADINKIRLSERRTGFKMVGVDTKEINNDEVTIRSGRVLNNALSKVRPEEYERGVLDNIATKVKTIFSDETWESMDKKEKEKAILTIGLNTSLGSALAQYVKSISGAAVAEAEYNRLKDVFTAGNYSNIQSLRESISTFYSNIERSYMVKLNSSIADGGSFILNKIKRHKELTNMPTYSEAYKQIEDKAKEMGWSEDTIRLYLETQGY